MKGESVTFIFSLFFSYIFNTNTIETYAAYMQGKHS